MEEKKPSDVERKEDLKSPERIEIEEELANPDEAPKEQIPKKKEY
jgi:hypothetical protein